MRSSSFWDLTERQSPEELGPHQDLRSYFRLQFLRLTVGLLDAGFCGFISVVKVNAEAIPNLKVTAACLVRSDTLSLCQSKLNTCSKDPSYIF